MTFPMARPRHGQLDRVGRTMTPTPSLQTQLSTPRSPQITPRVSKPIDRRQTCPVRHSPALQAGRAAAEEPHSAAINFSRSPMAASTMAALGEQFQKQEQAKGPRAASDDSRFVISLTQHKTPQHEKHQDEHGAEKKMFASAMQRTPSQRSSTPPLIRLGSATPLEPALPVSSRLQSEAFECRLAGLEKSMDERLAAAAAEATRAARSMCTASENRCAQMVEASEQRCSQMLSTLREDLRKVTSESTCSNRGMLLPDFGMSDGIGKASSSKQKVQERDAAVVPSSQTENMMNMMIDRVMERLKEEEYLRKVTEQFAQVRSSLDDLVTQIGTFDGNSSHVDFTAVFNMLKATSLDVRRLRQQRNRDYSEAATRFEYLERTVGASMKSPRFPRPEESGDGDAFETDAKHVLSDALQEPQEEPQTCGDPALAFADRVNGKLDIVQLDFVHALHS